MRLSGRRWRAACLAVFVAATTVVVSGQQPGETTQTFRVGGGIEAFRASSQTFTIEVAEHFRDNIDAIHTTRTIQFVTVESDATVGRQSLEVRAKTPGLQVHAPKWISWDSR